MQTPALPLCSASQIGVRELTVEDATLLQAFFEANPDYFLIVEGEPAGPDKAREELLGELPPGWSFSKNWMLGYQAEDRPLVAALQFVSDLLAPKVWHIGLFIIANDLHGSGIAQTLYRDFETWARANGADWLRLCVVRSNVKAGRFWRALDFAEVRTRDGIEMGRLSHSVDILIKPLNGGTRDQYLSLIERDRPEHCD
ncbi:GNAT family N-acetyltransferase [Pseudomonas frederiksbergensis]|uniref:GNAT family N-acetyltransferase n=1 Tax=Pseudomonas frederiksbergensis TaxID=104087 RepID=UPI003CFE106C